MICTVTPHLCVPLRHFITFILSSQSFIHEVAYKCQRWEVEDMMIDVKSEGLVVKNK